jgi:hypothetical protein
MAMRLSPVAPPERNQEKADMTIKDPARLSRNPTGKDIVHHEGRKSTKITRTVRRVRLRTGLSR